MFLTFLEKPLSVLSDFGDSALVGGCVRDALMGHLSTDIDVATALSFDALNKRVRDKGYRISFQNLSYQTLAFVHEGRTYHFSPLRKDIVTNGRQAIIDTHASWMEDAQRRDFTINALYVNPSGVLWDPLGGRDDLERRCVRFIGDPDTRITQDSLRLWRYYRFWSFYGHDPTPQCFSFERHKEGVSRLSLFRVQGEFFKILMNRRVDDVLPLIVTWLSLHIPKSYRDVSLSDKPHCLFTRLKNLWGNPDEVGFLWTRKEKRRWKEAHKNL